MKIKDYQCKCGHNDFFFADKGSQKGIYCTYCGKWLKWADKDERNLTLNQEPTTKNDLGVDCISRQAVLDLIADYDLSMGQVVKGIHALNPVTLQEPKCKDCKWWKDSDGKYRRGCGAKSKCPINRKEVYEGNGYCYMFEPQESEG